MVSWVSDMVMDNERKLKLMKRIIFFLVLDVCNTIIDLEYSYMWSSRSTYHAIQLWLVIAVFVKILTRLNNALHFHGERILANA